MALPADRLDSSSNVTIPASSGSKGSTVAILRLSATTNAPQVAGHAPGADANLATHRDSGVIAVPGVAPRNVPDEAEAFHLLVTIWKYSVDLGQRFDFRAEC